MLCIWFWRVVGIKARVVFGCVFGALVVYVFGFGELSLVSFIDDALRHPCGLYLVPFIWF